LQNSLSVISITFPNPIFGFYNSNGLFKEEKKISGLRRFEVLLSDERFTAYLRNIAKKGKVSGIKNNMGDVHTINEKIIPE
jgi:hypothetical protein